MNQKLSRREIELNRKQRMARVNRFLGWLTFAAFLLPRTSLIPIPETLAATLRSSFMFFIMLHAIAAVYLYGVPTFNWHPRVVQMMLGFLIVVVFLLNRTFIFVPVLLRITEIAMWVPIILHVLLGARYLIHRIIRPSTYKSTPYYLGGAIVRDFTRR